MPTVLSLCNIPESLNIEEMKVKIKAYMASREQYYREKNRAPFVEDEFAEYFTAKTTGGTEIGSGSCGMDVKTKNGEGIDAMCVIMKSICSHEKSLMQNFSESGNNLDKLFLEKKDKEAVQMFAKGYLNKLQKTKTDKNLSQLYILAFISTMKDLYLVCLKIDLENIEKITSGGFIREEKGDCKNILIQNFIDSNYGNVKLYKSKKRMELRLHSTILQTDSAVLLYSMPEAKESVAQQ